MTVSLRNEVCGKSHYNLYVMKSVADLHLCLLDEADDLASVLLH